MFCPMLRPLAGKRAQTVRSLITWTAFVMWRWHIENNVSQSALVPLLQLIVQVISVAGAHESANIVAEALPDTIFKLRKWFGMDEASNFLKMVCCNKCYRIYHDTPKMRYRDHNNKLLARRCFGEVVENGTEQLCNEVLFNCKTTDRGTHKYTPKHIYCYQPLSKSLDNLLSRRTIQGTFTTAVVSKSALNLFYDGKSPPGTIYYGKKSVREFFTTDWEVILQVKTCSKGPNLRQGKPPVVNIIYGGKRSKKGAKLRICSPAIFYFEFMAGYDRRWVYKPIFLFCYTGHSVHESIYQYVVVISVNSNVSVLFPICYLNLLHHFLAVMGRVIPNGQCARSMPLSTWLRPNAFKKKKNHRCGGGMKRCRAQRTTRPRVDPRVLWPRSRDFERRFWLTPAMVEYLAGQFYNSSIYVTEGDDPDGKGHPIPVFQKVFVLFAYISY